MEEEIKEISTELEILQKEIKEAKESKEFWVRESAKWETKFKNLKQAISSVILIVE